MGKLDMIRASTQAFAVFLDDGKEARAVLANGDIADHAHLLKQRVQVLGRALFKPSRRLLRIDAESISPSDDESGLFSKLPQPIRQKFDLRAAIEGQRSKKGLAAVIGQWSGDESDEDIARALRDFR